MHAGLELGQEGHSPVPLLHLQDAERSGQCREPGADPTPTPWPPPSAPAELTGTQDSLAESTERPQNCTGMP